MADKRISQLVERTDIANNDVVPIVASGATTTNKATISSIQEFMQENLDLGVTSVGITLGTTGTDVSVSGSPITTSGNITINLPTASATNRGLLSAADWTTFNNKQAAGNYVTLDTAQTITGAKTFELTDLRLAAEGSVKETTITNVNADFAVSTIRNYFGFNNANNIFFSSPGKQGAILSFDYTQQREYALPDADGTIALTSQLGDYVTLNTAQTITAQKTFTTSGSSDTMIISHGSGSGFALDVIKAGNGEAIRVQKTSGSGNAMTISGGNFEAGTIVRTGGTSSQFLKADGSVDSSTYLTTSTAASTYVPYTGATGAVDLGTHTLSANNVIANGGFNAGALLLKNANAASTINTGYFTLSPSSTTTQISFGFSTGASTWKRLVFSSHLLTDNTPTLFSLPNGGGTLAVTTDLGAYLPLTGGTLTGALNGTSASFTGDITRTSSNIGGINEIAIINTATSGASSSRLRISTAVNGGTTLGDAITQYTDNNNFNWSTGSGVTTSRDYVITNHFTLGTNVFLRLAASTGAATFSSSVTAASFLLTKGSITNDTGYGTGFNVIGSATTYIGSSTGIVGFIASNGEQMRLTSTGLGIGTTSPSTSFVLDVHSQNLTFNSRLFQPSSNTGAYCSLFVSGAMTSATGYFGIGGSAVGNTAFRDSVVIGSQSASPLVFNTSDFERMRITSAGNVGIGNTGSNAKLEVTASSGEVFRADASGGAYRIVANQTQVLLNGNVGIGTLSPSQLLDIVGSNSTELGALRLYNSSGSAGSQNSVSLLMQVRNSINNLPSVKLIATEATNDSNLGELIVQTSNDNSSTLSEVVRIAQSGAGGARFIRMASGTGGIQFNGDTAAANALDDYEEGTWTPTIGGTWITNPTSLSGLYTKIGNMVYIRLEFVGGLKASTTSGWIDGLPFSGAVGGGGTVSNVSVQNRGIALLDNNTRVWLTELEFLGITTKVMASYRL